MLLLKFIVTLAMAMMVKSLLRYINSSNRIYGGNRQYKIHSCSLSVPDPTVVINPQEEADCSRLDLRKIH